MKKIKIVRIIARLNIGGPAIHAVLLTEGLDKNKFESLLVCGCIDKKEGDMSYYAVNKDVIPIYVRQLRREVNVFNDFAAFLKICAIINKEKPDIIHTHTAKAGAIGRLAVIACNLFNPYFWKKSIKLAHTFHGHVFSGYFNKIETAFFLVIEKILAVFTARIITVSESVKSELVYFGIANTKKIEVIYLGFELDKFLAVTPRNSNVINIGIIGRLVPIKNHRLFLEAAAEALRRVDTHGIRFKIIGDGELAGELKEYSEKLNIAPYVDFLGWKKDIADVYSELDIVALTSLNEGTPVSLIEAMASARVVIATNVGGVRDLMGDVFVPRADDSTKNFKVLERGILDESGNSDSFPAALIFALKNPEIMLRMANRSRDYVSHRFTKVRLVSDIEILYDSILANK